MHDLSTHWTLDRDTSFLNHGSFGACPRAVLQHQAALRERLEAQPVRFFGRELPALLDAARERVALLVGADARELAFVQNATTGVSTVLASQRFGPGDELLVTDHAYGASRNALDFFAAKMGAHVVVAKVPFPLRHPDEVVEAVLARVTARTRLALLDHVTSPTGLVFPLARIIAELRQRSVRTLIDGAHAPGMLPLDLRALGADYYTGNCHKWLCAPKSVAFLHVPVEHQAGLRPLVISHGATAAVKDRSRYWLELDWTGTSDPTPALCVPVAIDVLQGLLPGGLPALYAENRTLALLARDKLCAALQTPPPCPDEMIGSMAAVPLPDGDAVLLHDRLLDRHAIEVPVVPWPAAPKRLLRISAQQYNRIEQYDELADVLAAAVMRG